MARPKEKTLIVITDAMIKPHRTESIGPLGAYRNECVSVTMAEAQAYTLLGYARAATDEEAAAFYEDEAFREKLAKEAVNKDAKDADAVAKNAADREAEAADVRAAIVAAAGEE